MFDQTHKTVALTFARTLGARDYEGAYGMLSASAQSQTSPAGLRKDFEAMIPAEFGDINPIEVLENPAFDSMFVYVVLGGAVYSEAVIVEAFATEGGAVTIDRFQFGRP